jgi:hypothetical protein
MLLSMDRVAMGQSPVLHETAHALLTFGTRFDRPPERRPTWLVEGHAEFVTKTMAKQEGLYDSDTFNLGTLDTLHNACLKGLPAMQEFNALRFIGTGGAPEGLTVTDVRPRIAPAFYACATSFAKFLADEIGPLAVTDLLHEVDTPAAITRASGRSIEQLQEAWQRAIGIVAK